MESQTQSEISPNVPIPHEKKTNKNKQQHTYGRKHGDDCIVATLCHWPIRLWAARGARVGGVVVNVWLCVYWLVAGILQAWYDMWFIPAGSQISSYPPRICCESSGALLLSLRRLQFTYFSVLSGWTSSSGWLKKKQKLGAFIVFTFSYPEPDRGLES